MKRGILLSIVIVVFINTAYFPAALRIESSDLETSSLDSVPVSGRFALLSLQNHNPIYITGNQDFIAQATAEGWQGNGTEGSPYLITGFQIYGTGNGIPGDPFNPPPIDYSSPTRFLINIKDVDLHFRITDCSLVGAGTYGIYLENVTHAAILSNKVTRSDRDGIRLERCLNSTINDNLVYSNSLRGIDLRGTNSSEISNNSAYSNGVNGIYLGGSWNNTVSNNVAHYNLWHGISIDSLANYNSIMKNTVYQNARVGVGLWGQSNYNVLSENYIYDNEESGISLFSSDYNVILFNTIHGNNEGFSSYETGSNTIKHNEIAYSNYTGLYLFESKDAILFNNTVFENEEGLILSLAWNTSVSFNLISFNRHNGMVIDDSENNNVNNNQISNNGEHGVVINAEAVGNVITNNEIMGNGGYGIWTESLENTIADNEIAENGGEVTTYTVISSPQIVPPLQLWILLFLVLIGGSSVTIIVSIARRSRRSPVYSWKPPSETRSLKYPSGRENHPKFCPNCGVATAPKDIFCMSCGSLLV
ncbi:MAG: right-handed parallel beta-helix repeat-containing protein [Candidatus Thorarchaeota archaeon]